MPESKLQVLLVIIDLRGGAGAFCRLLASGLNQFHADRVAVSLLVWRREGLQPDDSNLFRQIHVIGSEVHADARRFYEPLRHALMLKRALSQIERDVILTVGTYSNLVVPAVTSCPTVLSEHANVSERLKHSRYGPAIRFLMRRRYPGRTVVVPAEGVADDLRSNYGVADVRMIHHGVDADAIRRRALEPADGVPARPYIVAVGRLDIQKDYPTLVQAFSLARKRGLREDLAIVGGGPEEERLRALAGSLGLAGTVHLLGQRDNPFPVMRGARLFVMSSIWEGFGLVLPEAMSLGLPCIATDCPSGPAEIFANGAYGVLVPPSDPDALATALIEATAEPRRQQLAALSLQRAQDFTLARMSDAYFELLSEAAQPVRDSPKVIAARAAPPLRHPHPDPLPAGEGEKRDRHD